MKVPVLVTLLSDDRSSRQALGPAEQTDATAALEHSDNPAAEALFAELEQRHGGLVGASQALQRTLQRAGDTHVTVNTAPNDQGFTTWGQSIWSTSGEIDFYRSLAAGCLLDPQDTAYVLGLMQHVVPAQRWGAGAAGYPSGILLAFKAGWGPEANGGYVVRQTAIVGTEGRGYVVSMIALPSDGSFADGVALIDDLARWAREHVITTQHGPVGCPSR